MTLPLLLAAELLCTTPAPLDLPRAESHLVEDEGRWRLEDRYDVNDLWLQRTLDGRWVDDEGRFFLTATYSLAPPLTPWTECLTRVAFEKTRGATLTEKESKRLFSDERNLAVAVACLTPGGISGDYARAEYLPRVFRDVRYYLGTNLTRVVCAYRLENDFRWHLASLFGLPSDDPDELKATLTDEILPTLARGARKKDAPPASRPKGKVTDASEERRLAYRDLRHNVAAYPSWHCTGSDEILVLDNLPGSDSSAACAVTNELAKVRREFGRVVPVPLAVSNAVTVARIYANRADYLCALGINNIDGMDWSAAYWSESRREIVAYLPRELESLLSTLRHEAFHQYLSYGLGRIPAAPWFNEGYAQYFEGCRPESWVDRPATDAEWTDLQACADRVLEMDYAVFYDPDDDARALNYRLAWSFAYFLETGARQVRFDPYRNFKRDYLAELFATRDASAALSRIFDSAEVRQKFLDDWRDFFMEGD